MHRLQALKGLLKRHCCNISNNNNIKSCSAKCHKNLKQNKTGNENIAKIKTISIKHIFYVVFKCVFLDKIGQKEPSKNTFHHCNKNANCKNPLFKIFSQQRKGQISTTTLQSKSTKHKLHNETVSPNNLFPKIGRVLIFRTLKMQNAAQSMKEN